MQYRRICVFCGASNSIEDEYKELAFNLAKALGQMNIEIVYGGSTSGLMGIVARTAKQYGAKITGVFPKLLGLKEKFNDEADEAMIVETLCMRKDIMISHSNAFIVLPGGFGTLDELFEVLTMKNLGVSNMLNKPIWILNHNQFWQPLYNLFEHLIKYNFASNNIRQQYEFISSIEQLLRKIENHATPKIIPET